MKDDKIYCNFCFTSIHPDEKKISVDEKWFHFAHQPSRTKRHKSAQTITLDKSPSALVRYKIVPRGFRVRDLLDGGHLH